MTFPDVARRLGAPATVPRQISWHLYFFSKKYLLLIFFFLDLGFADGLFLLRVFQIVNILFFVGFSDFF